MRKTTDTVRNGLFLTDLELYSLTGEKRKSLQIEWLMERMWLYEITRTGHPRVAREYFERRMVHDQFTQPATAKVVTPDFNSLKRKAA